MKRTYGPVQCDGFCEYYWDGALWELVSNNCSAGCHCMAAPEPPPPNTPPFFTFVQCMPMHRGRKRSGKGERPSVRINVSEDVELCLIHVPRPPKKKGK